MRGSAIIVALVIAASTVPFAQREEVLVVVVDLDSRLPIAHARVASASTQPIAPAFTDQHGAAAVSVASGGRTIRVGKPGYVPQTMRLDAGADAVEVRLARSGAISGRIVDTLGVPVVNRPVLVALVADRGQPPRTVRTDDLGEYRIGTLAEGTYVVSLNQLGAAAPGGPPSGTALDALPHTVVVRRGEEVGGTDFAVAARSTCRAPAAFGLFGEPSVFTSISGRVTTVDGTPLPCVEVVAFRGAPVSSASTDNAGRYTLPRLRAGAYRLEYTLGGYMTRQWGQANAGEPGRPVVVRDRENLSRIDIVLVHGGALTGMVSDEFGEPVENIMVRALQLRGEDDRAIAVATGTAQTDDRGHYRLFGLLPGRYLVSAAADNEPPDRRTGRGYPTAYFPGTIDAASATPVDVSENQERAFTDFSRVPSRVATITGTAVNSKNLPVTDRVVLVASQRSGAVIVEMQGADVRPDGTFTISNVPPGDYVVQATSKRGPDEPPEFGMQYTSVDDTDPLPLRIQTRAGVDVRGRLIEEGVPPVDPRMFSIVAIPVNWDQTSLLLGVQTLTVDTEGMLALDGVTGPRRFVLSAGPSDWYLKSIRVRGRDVTDDRRGVSLAGIGFARDLEVVVSNAGATIEGDVADGAASVAGYSVVLFASNPDHWYRNSRFVKVASANTAGKFRIAGIPEGDYFVAAVDELDGSAAGAWQTRAFLESLIASARRLHLREGDARSMSLALAHR
jgi:hypothetical protein